MTSPDVQTAQVRNCHLVHLNALHVPWHTATSTISKELSQVMLNLIYSMSLGANFLLKFTFKEAKLVTGM